MAKFKVGDKVRITNGGIPGCPGHALRVGSTATITSLRSDGLGAALSGIGDHGRPISQTLWFAQFEAVTAPKFKVGDKVRIVGPSQTGGDVRRGEVVTVSSVQTDYLSNTWYNVTVRPRCPLSTYAATSLEAVVEPPAVKAPYIVMLRGKDGRLAPSSHPAEHDASDANLEANRLAKKHGETFEVWKRDYKVEPPAPPKHKFSVGDQVRVIGNTAYDHNFRVGSIATITELLNDPLAYEAIGVCDDRDVVSQILIARDVESL